MNILHVVPNIDLSQGGPSRTTVYLANNLSDYECKILFYAHGSKDCNRLSFSLKVVDLVSSSNNSFLSRYICADYFVIQDIIKKYQIDLLHIHGVWHLLGHWSARAAASLNVPYIIQPRGMLEPWAMNYKRLKKLLAMTLYQGSDLREASGFVATSDQEARSILALCGSNQVTVIPNGVEPAAHHPFLNKVASRRTALFMSRIHPKKGVYELVRAWARVRPEGWCLRIVGPDDGGHLDRIRRLVDSLSVGSIVSVVGPVYGVSREVEFAGASLFVLPTYSENFGVAVAEALSYGIPVLTTKGAPWSSIVDNKCGWWIDPGEESLVNALPKALSISDAERFEMGARAKKLAANFEWGSVARQTLDFYSKVISESKNNSYKY